MTSQSHVSVLDVHHAIRNNDEVALKNAIFFLGVRVHKLIVWSHRTPLYYAAFLGHLDLVKILISDLGKYGTNFYASSWFGQVLNHHETQRQSVSQIVEMTLTRCEDFRGFDLNEVLEELVAMPDAADLVDLALKGRESFIRRLLLHCFSRGRPFSNLPLWVRQHEDFIPFVNNDPRPRTSYLIDILQDEFEEIKTWIREIAQEGSTDADLFDAMITIVPAVLEFALEEGMMEQTLAVSGWAWKSDSPRLRPPWSINIEEATIPVREIPALQLLLLDLLSAPTTSLVKFVLSHEKFDKSYVDWTRRYYRLLLEGSVEYASCIKHLVDFSESKKKEMFEHFKDQDCSKMNKESFGDYLELSVDEFTEAIAALISLGDLTDSPLGDSIKNLPMKENRLDLFLPVSQFFTLDYGEADIQEKEKNEMSLRLPEIYEEKHPSLVGEGAEMASLMLGDVDCRPWCCFLEPDFLDFLLVHHKHADISKLYRRGELYLLRKDYVPGTRVPEPDRKYVLHDHFEILNLDVEPLLIELQTARFENLDLQKLCRLAIRKKIMEHLRSTGQLVRQEMISLGRVMDGISALYVQGRIPKPFVDYLLHRENDKALYYKLLSP